MERWWNGRQGGIDPLQGWFWSHAAQGASPGIEEPLARGGWGALALLVHNFCGVRVIIVCRRDAFLLLGYEVIAIRGADLDPLAWDRVSVRVQV